MSALMLKVLLPYAQNLNQWTDFIETPGTEDGEIDVQGWAQVVPLCGERYLVVDTSVPTHLDVPGVDEGLLDDDQLPTKVVGVFDAPVAAIKAAVAHVEAVETRGAVLP